MLDCTYRPVCAFLVKYFGLLYTKFILYCTASKLYRYPKVTMIKSRGSELDNI